MSHYIVYSLQSLIDPSRYYIGITTDIEQRLSEHNSGKSIHTNKFKPWKLMAYIGFSDKIKAQNFESYLKTGSGRTFCKRHF